LNFHFLRPEWLWALIPLIGLLCFMRYQTLQRANWRPWIAPHLLNALCQVNSQSPTKLRWWPLAILWALTIFALAGPSWFQVEVPMARQTSGRVILFDLSLSMQAADVKPNRLLQAKYKVTDLLKNFHEGEIGLIAYAGEAYVLSPLTADHQNLLHLLPALSPNIMPAPGSNIGDAIQKSVQILQQSGHQQGDLIWITDGISPEQVKQVTQQMDSRYRLLIYGFGTAEGAPIALNNGQLMKDQTGNIVISQLKDAPLIELAAQYKGAYIHASAARNDWEQLIELLNQQMTRETDTESGLIWQDAGFYFTWILIIPMLFAFRRGQLYAVACISLGLLGWPKPSYAAWWKNDRQTAVDAYQNQDYATAYTHAEDDPVLKAAAAYQQGQYEEAIQLWQAKPTQTSNSYYNQGNAYLKLKQFDQAIDLYQQALQQQPYFPEAQANLELAQQLKEQQKQEQQEDKKEEQPQDQKNQSQNKQDQPQSEPGNEPQQAQDQPQSEQGNEPQQAQDQSQSEPGNEQQQAQDQPQSEPGNEPQQAQNDQQDPSNASAQIADHDATAADDPMPAHLQRMLHQIQDDPTVLLQNKMKLEYLKRRQQSQPKEQQPW
jgi:Ca-activated chloride channel homolog